MGKGKPHAAGFKRSHMTRTFRERERGHLHTYIGETSLPGLEQEQARLDYWDALTQAKDWAKTLLGKSLREVDPKAVDARITSARICAIDKRIAMLAGVSAAIDRFALRVSFQMPPPPDADKSPSAPKAVDYPTADEQIERERALVDDLREEI